MSIRYTNIQRMCIHDGPGIRTTVFLKGCNLVCPWCCNPENINAKIEYYFQQEECRKIKRGTLLCGHCIVPSDKFPSELIIKDSKCPFGYIGKYGKDTEAEEMLEILLKDREYWGVDGGVTFSGGEALLQIKQLIPLLKLLKEERISVAFETALHVAKESVNFACLYSDFFYVDVKLLDKEMCSSIIHGSIELFLQNVEELIQKKKNIVFRVPCCDKYTLADSNKKLLLEFFQKYKNIPVEIFAIHSLGQKKYESLNRKCFENPKTENMISFYERLVDQGNQVRIIHI